MCHKVKLEKRSFFEWLEIELKLIIEERKMVSHHNIREMAYTDGKVDLINKILDLYGKKNEIRED